MDSLAVAAKLDYLKIRDVEFPGVEGTVTFDDRCRIELCHVSKVSARKIRELEELGESETIHMIYSLGASRRLCSAKARFMSVDKGSVGSETLLIEFWITDFLGSRPVEALS